ncbi:MAG TPA: right-handed parallel beta-helix repeat-containing protein [Candidatus Paceibacterota bacterium]|nr:right-handed parallel beta-helix repeat-containing protein [Verrucomicrobiota bacterium]HOX02114.1 right-handed parallel beta-helix repeat-containing protein [Verrucomicrobiota bacterium]HRZ44944.1 right-handed parallel beta-helix repeat-containing protein [Candidatus Paceibacterota bacterium]
MKRRFSYLAGLLGAFVLIAPSQAAITPLVNHGDTWLYHKGTNPPPSDWKTAEDNALDPSQWSAGMGGFGFGTSPAETNHCKTVLFDSPGTSATNYTTIYMRKTFSISDAPADDEHLFLRMDFDDGYIAWLDGAYLAHFNVDGAPAEPAHIDRANANHECSTGQASSSPRPPQTNDLGLASSLLPPGAHTLAIIGLNVSRTSTDFIQVADLYLEAVRPPPAITNGVGGVLAADTTWRAANGYYAVTSNIIVPSNATLTIEPGVTVCSRAGVGITVHGRLVAEGATNQPITFTRYPGDANWERIMLVEAADSRFRNCIFEFANSAGDHKTAYYATNCAYPMNVAPRSYYEAVVALACRVEFDGCIFRNLYTSDGSLPEGDAIGIFSDDPVHRGPASAYVRGCQFRYIGQGVHTRYAYALVEGCYFVGKTGDNDDVEMYGESTLYGLPSPEVRGNFFDIPCHDDRIHPTRCSAIIRDNVIYGDPNDGDHCIVLRDTCCPIVYNNVMFNSPNGGIAIQNGCDALIANNTFYGIDLAIKLFDHQSRIGYPYCLSAMSGRATVVQCIVWNGDSAIDVSGSSGMPFTTFQVDVSYCDFQGGTNSLKTGSNRNYAVTWGPGMISADPLLLDGANRDARLAAPSPCIDAGLERLGVYVTTNTLFEGTNRITYAVTNDLSLFVTRDLDGMPRPLDGDADGQSRHDLGAFEALHPAADSNHDGIPDVWCQRYGLNPIAPEVAWADPDRDFQSTLREYLAGTDPTNGTSYAVFPLPFGIDAAGRDWMIRWSNASPAGVVSLLTSTSVFGPWQPRENHFTTQPAGQARLSQGSETLFCKLLAVDLSTNTPRHFTNLIESYGILETVAGRGLSNDDESQWQPSYEGEWATNVCLSRPHNAFGDSRGNVLIVDQRSSSVLRVTPEGRLYTHAGTHIAGFNGDGPGAATNLHLNNPNGGWMGSNDVLYVLDTDNAKVRRITPDGVMTTLFTAADPMGDGRALWVPSDESAAYFGSGGTATNLYQWSRSSGAIRLVRDGFKELGNIVGDERTGDLFISDRGANRVYRLSADNTLTPIAGNGTQSGGGDGFPALQTGLIHPRGIWFLPNGGFFTCEHSPGNRIWYIDPAGIIHRWINGSDANNFRMGDGQWFYADPSVAKVSRVRAVNTDPFGNLIITESNYGYVRRIRFQRMNP